MRVLVSGSTGLVGSRLAATLERDGANVVELGRRPATTDGRESIVWDPAGGQFDATPASGCDAVVHLAGENIAGGRWTKARLERIRSSRIDGTRLLVERLLELDAPPTTWVMASAIGYYGARGDEELTEVSAAGHDLLGEMCEAWEAAAQPAVAAGHRVVWLRIGLVLSPAGGALAKMLTPFRLGVGGVVGSGRQWMSWITIDDLIGVIRAALTDDRYVGPINATAPNPATNREFTKSLGRVLRRPTVLPLPAFAARLVFGRMADHLLLSGQRVLPSRLLDLGHTFGDADLEPALERLLRS